jgi:hypothetical protein
MLNQLGKGRIGVLAASPLSFAISGALQAAVIDETFGRPPGYRLR